MLASLGSLKPKQYRNLTYPLIASIKVDGYRAFSMEGNLWSRAKKPFPNLALYSWFYDNIGRDALDGEIHIPHESFQRTQEVVTRMMEPAHEVQWWIFDTFLIPQAPYSERLEQVKTIVKKINDPRLKVMSYRWIASPSDLKSYIEEVISEGWEGVMLRSPNAPYKFGRSTLREQGLLRIKPTVESEARIIGVVSRKINTNPSEPDNYGKLKKRKTVDAIQPLPEVGKFVCQSLDEESSPYPFEIGSGWDRATGREWWKIRRSLKGRIIRFKYQQFGTLHRPRQPVFLCFRDEFDHLK